MKKQLTIFTVLTALLITGCQKWEVVRFRGPLVPDGTIGLSFVARREAFVQSNVVAVAKTHGLTAVTPSGADVISCFTSPDYDGRFVLSLSRVSKGTEFEITIAKSPAFKRSDLSHAVDADLRERLPGLELVQEGNGRHPTKKSTVPTGARGRAPAVP